MHHEQARARSKAGTGAAVDFAGTWVNELKSEMVLVQTGDVLSGSYGSAGGVATATLADKAHVA